MLRGARYARIKFPVGAPPSPRDSRRWNMREAERRIAKGGISMISMAISQGVTLQTILGSLVGSTNFSTILTGGTTVSGTISTVGTDVLVYSPSGAATVVIPFGQIDRIIQGGDAPA